MRLREKSNKTQFQFPPLEVGNFEDKTTIHYAHTHTREHFTKDQRFWEHSDTGGSETSSETGRLPTGAGPLVSASPGKLLDMQSLRSVPDPFTELATLVGA